MVAKRLGGVPGFSIDRVAAAAGTDADILRMENLDTDLPPPDVAIAVTEQSLRRDDANSYLPFDGRPELKRAVSGHLSRQTGQHYDPDTEVVITCGGTEGMLDALLSLLDPGDEVILTDPTYAGMINRVRLADGVPRQVPLDVRDGEFHFDPERLRRAVTARTRVLFLMSPSMPSGALFDEALWQEAARLCHQRSLVLLYNAAMERIVFDGRRNLHPASLPGMRERTIIVGSVSKEYRMIGWRVGWVAGPAALLRDIRQTHIYNVVTPTGISQLPAAAALEQVPQDVPACVAEWERRRNAVMEALRAYPLVRPAGGWSLLVDVRAMGLDSFEASRRLLEKGRVAATPMRDWGEENGDRYLRLVYSNEPVERLATLEQRFGLAFG